MKHVFSILCITLVALLAAPKSYATDMRLALQDFDARALTVDDKRFLQAALAFEGQYNGLIDGAWGRISQAALERYAQQKWQSRAENWHMAMLAASYFENYTQNGWEMRYFEPMGLSLLYPYKSAVSDPPSENFANWKTRGSSFSFSLGVHNRDYAQSVHDYVGKWHELNKPAYSVRKPNIAVTSSQKRDGSLLYARSDLVNGLWSTVLLASSGRDKPTLNAVAASIVRGRARPLMFTEGGSLDIALKEVLASVNEADARSNPAGSNEQPEPSSASSGTGFVVSKGGHVLTNAHVVEGCSNLTIGGTRAFVLDSSEEFDLALVVGGNVKTSAIARFSPSPARLNSDVTVAGFPYAGLLDGLNITRGSVSSLKGLGGNSSQLQISAPVQPGNSGGPVLSKNGNVVGVVVSKLDALVVADLIGDIPQNVNFAVRGEIAKLFLAQNNITPSIGSISEQIQPTDLADLAREFTVFIKCD